MAIKLIDSAVRESCNATKNPSGRLGNNEDVPFVLLSYNLLVLVYEMALNSPLSRFRNFGVNEGFELFVLSAFSPLR